MDLKQQEYVKMMMAKDPERLAAWIRQGSERAQATLYTFLARGAI